ncbi:trypsin-like peptidase domain-containing protein [Nostocaceae cyanobacterium CENA369]|uniref:Trypsin-like peptidase domain-containing protein n=1 Tax=Dendronalium phyllosphericum CENA369 TaxID=1725256 RepID=A0A8J7I357_9NOST|nr:serine protease [Dendronalium phyllosphericum]MBH8573745.1 trypsin-like peptidase domain-containing protein [Dendronalium phyllosphericum CENA369]
MNQQWLRSKLGYTVCLIVCLGSIWLALPRKQSNSSESNKFSRSSTPLSVEQLQQLAKTITVKIYANELLGSGTLLQRKGQIYTVVTNAHVLRAAKPPYQIQTPNGQVYEASVLQVAKFQKNDLAALQFRSPDVVYTIANVKDTSSLQVGDEVFVGGFTSDLNAQKLSTQTNKIFNNQFVFTSGRISLLLNKALDQGYQIGYTNDVRKGMSGAPLLNKHGEVIGINSLHKDPIWDTPEVYQDGSQPEQSLQKLITGSSMAVPIRELPNK